MGVSPLMASRPPGEGLPQLLLSILKKAPGKHSDWAIGSPLGQSAVAMERITVDCGCPNRRRSWKRGGKWIAEEAGHAWKEVGVPGWQG